MRRFATLRRASLSLTLLLLCVSLAIPAFAGSGGGPAPRKGILLVAFGTTVPEARVSLDKIETAVRNAFPDTEVRWAYSAKQVRNTVRKNEGKDIPSPAAALAQMGDEGFTHVAVQSLQTIPGEEYHNLLKTAEAFNGMPKGTQVVTVGVPMLYSPDDIEKAATALVAAAPKERKAAEALVFMGHGTHHFGNIFYPGLQFSLSKADPNTFVGTVEGTPSLDDVVATLSARNIRTVWLMPLMAVAGDHAQNDMAGPEDDSWKSVLESKGFTVHTVLKGTGEHAALAALWVAHLKDAFAELDN